MLTHFKRSKALS